MLFLNLMKQNPLPVDVKFVAHGIEKHCPSFLKKMGNVFGKDGQRFPKLRATENHCIVIAFSGNCPARVVSTDALSCKEPEP